ncbi:MAG TPA: hypothetical protein PK360_05155, partial [bacterium]|nr:hypothetical protein [bacterium]
GTPQLPMLLYSTIGKAEEVPKFLLASNRMTPAVCQPLKYRAALKLSPLFLVFQDFKFQPEDRETSYIRLSNPS